MDASNPTIAIVGAGFLGSALARAAGGPCVATTRSGRWRDGTAPEGIHIAKLDLTAERLDVEPLESARALVIAVSTGGTQDRRAVYVDGTRRLLEAVGRSPWNRVVYVSSTSAFAEVDGWVDESTTRPPSTERGRVQVDAEQVVARWATGRAIPWICVRLGGLYGPGRGLDRIYGRTTTASLPGDGWTATNLIHLDDAVRATLAAVCARPEIVGIVGVVDDDHRPRRAMVDAIARHRGAEPIPWESPVAPGSIVRGKRVSNVRMKLDLGVRLGHPTHVLV
jgi:nucleoside-diphosphate-sugar epimerase